MFDIKKDILETHEALLDVTIDDETVKQAMRKAARDFSRKANIPGFRRGHAPYSRVLRYVGEDAIRQQASDDLLEELYPKIIEAAGISPYSAGQLENIQQEPLNFTLRVPLQPEVILGDYQSLRAEWEDATVTDEEIASIAEQIREENATLEPQERSAQYSDEVHINITGTIDGELVVDESDVEVILSEDTPFIAPEFVESLVGMINGEERSITVNFPEDFAEEAFRGQQVQFDVQVVGIYERVLPAFDDALASTVGAFETVDALKQDIYNRLLEAKAQQQTEAYREKLVAALVAQAEVHYPPAMLEDALDDLVKSTGERIQRERKMSLEDALQLEGLTLAQFREHSVPQAKATLERVLALRTFAEQEGIEVSDDDVVLEYHDLFARLGQELTVPDVNLDLDSTFAQSLRSTAFERKIMERLEQIGRGEAEDNEALTETEEAATEETEVEPAENAVEKEISVVEPETPMEASTDVAEEMATEEDASPAIDEAAETAADEA